MKRGKICAPPLTVFAVLSTLLVVPPPVAAALQEEGRVIADTLTVDTLWADTVVADTLPTDTAAVPPEVDLEARREALAAEGFPERDAAFRQLSELAGFRSVEYRGERVELDLNREAVELRGNAQSNYATSVLEADSITYRIPLQFMAAQGQIRLVSDGASEVTSDSVLYYDISRRTGTIMDARTTFAERGTEWYVRGNATPRGDREVFVERGSFTSCELERPHYFFKAGQLKVVSDRAIVAWPVVLYIEDVPVAWLPFFASDIRPGRRSGFLPPRFGVNDIVQTSEGMQRTISDFGYYFAINDFLDAQTTVDWFSGSFTRLNAAVRYRDIKRFLRGNLMTSYSFGPSGRSVEFRGNHDQELTPVTQVRLRAAFVQNTQLFQDRSFDPRQQTQNIDSDFGLTHRFPFANVSLSARRRQFLGTEDRTDLTLPQLNVSFSPVTLFRAPRAQAGLFNNITWSGGLNLDRQSQSREFRDDLTTTRGRFNQSLRIADITIAANASLDDRQTVPFDTLGAPSPFRQTTVSYGGSTSYQIDLMGSTVLRPSLSLDGSAFRSPDTEDDFVSAPTRLSLGASLNTDLYGFYPGFGSFTRIRHKVSPTFSYSYSPEVAVADELLEIPGFPAAAARERNILSMSLSQTFEAKVRPRPRDSDPRLPPTVPGEPAPTDAPDRAPESEEESEEGEERSPAVDGPPAAPAGEPAVSVDQETDDEAIEGAAPAQRREERTVTLLSISSSPLQFDFTRIGEEPLLVTDRLTNSLNSDLLRGFNLRITHDLFEGVGADRRFRPFLSEVSTQFSFNSARGISGMFGLAEPGARAAAQPPIRQDVDARYRLEDFDAIEEVSMPQPVAGPWNLSLNYSLRRSRPDELTAGSTRETQSLGGSLALQPTPNWQLRWNTQYNLTQGEFGQHLLTLERDLHDWRAFFIFSRSPNGNFLFQLSVELKAAPELKVDYDQRSQFGN